MSGAGGFSADQAGMRDLAAYCEQRAMDLRSVNSDLLGLPAAAEADFGDALGAYKSFLEAWTDELRIEGDALVELTVKFTDTAADYQNQDVRWSHGFPSVDPLRSRPAQPGITTRGGPSQPGVTVQPGVTTGSR